MNSNTLTVSVSSRKSAIPASAVTVMMNAQRKQPESLEEREKKNATAESAMNVSRERPKRVAESQGRRLQERTNGEKLIKLK